jgi:hypothetical protein
MEASGHSALRFERIFNHSRIQEFAQINCLSYDVPEKTSLSLIKEEMFWCELAYGFIAYKGDKPVSTATAMINEAASFC